MSRLERWLWTAVYFASGFLVATTLVRLGAFFSLSGTFGLVAMAVCLSWIAFWKSFRRSIVRDLGWGVRIALSRVRKCVNLLLWAWVRRQMPRSELAGLVVYVEAASAEQRLARLDRFSAALEELRAVWPVRYDRLVRLAPVIYIGSLFPGAGGFVLGTRVIAIHESLVDRWTGESVVCVVCHELSHMLVVARGIRWTPGTDSRIERIANIEMRLWGLRLLHADKLDAQASAELATLIRESLRRWWWRPDGTRVHGGSVLERSTPAASGAAF